MASSSSNQHVIVEVGEENPYSCPYPYPYPYPYPSHVSAPNFVTLKLSGRNDYSIWKTQMLCLLKSHDMYGFIDGTLVSPAQTSSTSSSSVSGKEKVGSSQSHQTDHWLWTRSDALVKGWILGSLSTETLRYALNRLSEKLHHQGTNAAEDFSAKDVWDELHTMYAPAVFPQLPAVVEDTVQEKKAKERAAEGHYNVYRATLQGSWGLVQQCMRISSVTVIDKITFNGNTALHVAVDGSTLLHVAAIVGNTEAADILVEINRDLLLAKDNKGQTPLALAISNMHTETSKHLLQYINTDVERDALFSGTTGDELLVTVISSKDFCLASNLMKCYKVLHSDVVLMAVAQNFPSELGILDRHEFEIALSRIFNIGFSVANRREGCLHSWVVWVKKYIVLPCAILWLLVIPFADIFVRNLPFFKERVQNHDHAKKLLYEICDLTKAGKQPSSYHRYYTNPILEATRQNANEVVEEIVYKFPNAILSANEDGHNIFQYAVVNRSEKVYNLLYKMSEHNIYRTIRDSSRNNLLHLAARLAPTNKLNLISGAAIQIQRELQWFKELEGFVCPLSIIQKNSSGETPQMVFTREHKDLVIEREKWIKSTAESYTITAALIITIVFAAAITVPGGNNQDTGIPIFTNRTAFKVFAISDAISLFTAVTSLLMFLSILTARFAEQDFLLKLPTKLIIGLATLLISTTAMIVAFAATLYLVFGQRNSKILIPIAVLTCLPITSFVTLQFPLILDLISTTYGRSIFGKGRQMYTGFRYRDIFI